MMKKTWVKRTVAIGLIALMAVVNPLQNLGVGEEGCSAPSVAKAAEKGSPYLGEVRLAVDKKADKAKQILSDAGYEVIDRNLNEKAGSFWNDLGEQAVYMGIKRTSDEDKAIRDMKTMNMLGKYSYSDLKTRIEESKSKAKEIYSKLNTAIGEYTKNYKANDVAALEAHELMNMYREDDSGKLIGDFFLEDNTEEQIIKLLAEGNIYIISTIGKSLSFGAEEATADGATWLDRISKVTSYNMVVKRYAKQMYGTENVSGENRESVEKNIAADLDDTANTILNHWDEIRMVFLDEKESEATVDELLNNESANERVIEFSKNLSNLTAVEYAKAIPYGKRTLYDLFTVSAASFKKNIKNLYPLVYALSYGQRALTDTVEISDLFQAAVMRKTAEDKKSQVEKVVEDTKKEIASNSEPVSVYDSVDRAQFSENAAMTSQATANMSAGDNKTLLSNEGYKAVYDYARMIAMIVAPIFIFSSAALVYAKNNVEYLDSVMESVPSALKDDYTDELANFTAQTKYLPYVKWITFGITVAGVVVSAVMYYIDQKEKHNIKQLPIPDVLVDYDIENEAGRYVTYHAVKWNRDRGDKDRADRADLNGDAAKEWLALYTTTDRALGEPILADGIVANAGDNKQPASTGNGAYVPLTMFGQNSIQNLVDATYSFHDDVGGIWLWYQKGSASAETALEDDTEDTKEETLSGDKTEEADDKNAGGDAASDAADDKEAEEASETGSNIGGGSMALGITGGAVGGIIVGLLIGVFFRRKKQMSE